MNETDAAREEGAVSMSSDYSDLVALAMGGAQDVPPLPDTALVRHALTPACHSPTSTPPTCSGSLLSSTARR